jgi:hypothetical protein
MTSRVGAHRWPFRQGRRAEARNKASITARGDDEPPSGDREHSTSDEAAIARKGKRERKGERKNDEPTRKR